MLASILAHIVRFVTTPLLLLDLLLTSGLPWPTILITILMDEFMIVTGLVGALTRSSYKVCFQSRSHLCHTYTPVVGILCLWKPCILIRRVCAGLRGAQARGRSRTQC